ncbi:ABC-2 transporter permease [Clostridium sp. YIM B02505]|uniref:ABC-2 transporter permease n=1 Tax=Clostridium yunnanense TaxID=2800325 RepID=A0ABS1EM50_9CLOT|nr:ABC-2 transporter permease [Clostridium yunnanense]MBK1810423.1 ABC-2 transporter permease [Clostridium yunnanense]
MLNLVFKDLLIQKKSFLIAILYGAVFTVTFSNTSNPESIFIAVPSVIGYLFVTYACAYDDKNKSEIMLNSLPISRKDIVLSKYLSIVLYAIIGVCIAFIFTTAVKYLKFGNASRFMNLEDVLGAFISITFLCSIYYPVYFKFGYLKSKYLSMFMLLGSFFIPAAIIEFVGKGNTADIIDYLSKVPEGILKASVILILAVILLASSLLSLRIYLKRDL